MPLTPTPNFFAEEISQKLLQQLPCKNLYLCTPHPYMRIPLPNPMGSGDHPDPLIVFVLFFWPAVALGKHHMGICHVGSVGWEAFCGSGECGGATDGRVHRTGKKEKQNTIKEK